MRRAQLALGVKGRLACQGTHAICPRQHAAMMHVKLTATFWGTFSLCSATCGGAGGAVGPQRTEVSLNAWACCADDGLSGDPVVSLGLPQLVSPRSSLAGPKVDVALLSWAEVKVS